MQLVAARSLGCAVIFIAVLPQADATEAVVVNFRPQVKWVRPETSADLSSTGVVIQAGHKLTTGPRAEVTLRLSTHSLVRVGELAEVELAAPEGSDELPILSLLRGSFFAHSRRRASGLRIRTRTANAATEGTDFHVAVLDDSVLFQIFDGSIVVTNQHGSATTTGGMEVLAPANEKPRAQPIRMQNLIQWWLRYPVALDINELHLSDSANNALSGTIAAWRRGNIPRALEQLPLDYQPATADDRTFLAALELAAGQVGRVQQLLAGLETGATEGLRLAIAAVEGEISNFKLQIRNQKSPSTASGWLGLTWWHQSQRNLDRALTAARKAVALSPGSGFAWARTGELEFSHGNVGRARLALDRALQLTPEYAPAHVLRGFLHAVANRNSEALAAFDEALRLDATLPDAWLGRGLMLIRMGRSEAGRIALQNAVAAEPERAVLRSYLGKAWDHTSQPDHARAELNFARKLDPNDPTPWLYAALLNERDHRLNEAVHDLERSIALNDNRAVYRSQLLLDQDRSVRGANLARIYDRAGLAEVSLREASRATSYDYANWSAHLFLAESFDALRDPARVNLRYETPWFNELLLARLLAPAAAGPFSQNLSQQEYTRLFEADGVGFSSATEVRSDARYRERATQWGLYGGTSWAVDLDWERREDSGLNDDLSRLEIYPQLKQKVTERDSLLLFAKFYDYSAGDLRQVFEPSQKSRDLKTDVSQLPIAMAGWHHEWAPGIHTLLLGARLEDDQRVQASAGNLVVYRPFGPPFLVETQAVDLRYRGQFEVWSTELNQIVQWAGHTFVAGGRAQWGEFDTRDMIEAPLLFPTTFRDKHEEPFSRTAAYVYDHWELHKTLLLIAGVAYDRIEMPSNFLSPPVSAGTTVREQVGPKAGLVWSPIPEATVRAMYVRSLSGASFDESFRLEPSQIAGFNQAYRSLLSESFMGGSAGPEFELWESALDLKFATGTYLGFGAALRRSDEESLTGVFNVPGVGDATAGATLEFRDYHEEALNVSLHQLLGDMFAVGAGWQVTRAQVEVQRPEFAPVAGAPASIDAEGTLHELWTRLVFTHPSGIFARAEATWFRQGISGGSTASTDPDTEQVNLFAGWRLPRQRGELSAGILNLLDQDYRLSPLTPYPDLPRERVFLARVKLNF